MHLIAVAVLTPAMDATPEPPIRDNPYLSCRHIHTHAINHHTAIGYKEIISYLEGDCTLEEAISLIQKNSRHYAKRQYTFFRHQLPVHWISVCFDDFQKTIQEAIDWITKENSSR